MVPTGQRTEGGAERSVRAKFRPCFGPQPYIVNEGRFDGYPHESDKGCENRRVVRHVGIQAGQPQRRGARARVAGIEAVSKRAEELGVKTGLSPERSHRGIMEIRLAAHGKPHLHAGLAPQSVRPLDALTLRGSAKRPDHLDVVARLTPGPGAAEQVHLPVNAAPGLLAPGVFVRPLLHAHPERGPDRARGERFELLRRARRPDRGSQDAQSNDPCSRVRDARDRTGPTRMMLVFGLRHPRSIPGLAYRDLYPASGRPMRLVPNEVIAIRDAPFFHFADRRVDVRHQRTKDVRATLRCQVYVTEWIRPSLHDQVVHQRRVVPGSSHAKPIPGADRHVGEGEGAIGSARRLEMGRMERNDRPGDRSRAVADHASGHQGRDRCHGIQVERRRVGRSRPGGPEARRQTEPAAVGPPVRCTCVAKRATQVVGELLAAAAQ